MKKLLLFMLLLSFLVFACTRKMQQDQDKQQTEQVNVKAPVSAEQIAKKPRNVILMIGDGMGLVQITAGMYANNNRLELERFPIVGLHKSHAFDNLITDSAAGATAFACGKKTYNGAIGVTPDTVACTTLLEMAEDQGYATGLVATSTIVHATPASFIAHQKQRKMYEAIAADFLKTDIDFFIGGGKRFFDRRDTDDRNLYAELESKGYLVSDYFKKSLNEVPADPNRNYAFFTADEDPLPVAQGRDYLPLATQMAMDYLGGQKEKGFFLMVEGSQIDWGGHANSTEYIITEMQEFDEVLGKVLDFAEADGNTLVITTADHETGGFSIVPPAKMDSLATAFTTDYHTATMIPVFAYGPGAEAFTGIYENTAIFDKIRAAMKW